MNFFIWQACKQLQVLGNLTSIFDQAKMGVLADAVGISQHHDAITGTEKQHVYSDYVRRLADGEQSCISLSVQALQNIEAQHSKASDIEMPKRTASPTALFACRSLNVSQCDLSEQMQPSNTDESRLPIVIYNQLARMRVETLRIPLINPDPDRFQLINSSGSSHSFTLQPIPDQIQRLPERNSKATHELVFAAHLKPLGVTRYTLIQTQSSHVGRSPKVPNVKPNPESLAGKGFTLDLDPETLLPISITLTDKNQTIEFQHSLRYYPAMAGNNRKFENRASGAYIFRPNATRSLPIADNNIPKATFTQHGQWQHLELSYANYSFETIRIHPQLEHIEFDYLVGPIPIGDNVGREIVSEYRTSIESERLFWTDSNGRQDVLRQRNHRQTYTYDSNLEPVASNYYPINARVTIRDRTDDVVMSVLVDRSCGGASLQDGQLEVMLHRRLLFDDSFGVDEALNEPGTDGKGLIVRGRHWVHVGRRQQAVKFARLRSPQLTLPPLILFGRPGAAESDLMNLSKQVIDRSALHRSIESGLPDAVNLLTVELFPKNRVLVRLEHLYEKNELPDQKPIRIDLRQLFDERLVGHMVSAVETSLSASHARGTIKRLKWKTDDDHNELVDHKWNDRDSELKTKRKSFFYDRLFTPGRPQEDEFDAEMKWMECMAVGDFVVTLKPMQIRSYLVRLSGIDNSTDLRPNCPWNS